MPAKPEPFDVDKLISLETGVQYPALSAFFRSIEYSADAEKRKEMVGFAHRAGWRVLPEILAEESPDFFKPSKRYLFAVSCRALFRATHPVADFNDTHEAHNAAFAAATVAAPTAAVAITAATTANAAYKAAKSAVYAADAAVYAHNAAEHSNTLRQSLLLAMREDLIALHSNQTLAGRELWPKEAASLFDVNEWFGTFRKNLKRYERGLEITEIYKALLSGRIEQVIDKYPPDLFEKFFNSAKSDYDEWNRGHTTDDKDSTEAPADEEPPTGEIRKGPRDTLHSEGPSGTDHLNRDSVAKELSKLLNKNQSHKAIGLFGDWGVGKSTFVNLLRKHLRIPLAAETADGDEAAKGEKTSPDHYKTADYIGGEFNAWQYEHTDNIQAGLAQELIAALQANLSWWEKGCLTLLFAWSQHKVNLSIAVLSPIVALIFIVGFIFGWWQVPQWFSWLAGIGGLAAVWRYGIKAVAHPLAKELLTYLRLPSFGKELGTIPVMREQVKAMVKLRLAFFKHKQQRLLFVVDDLDRCSPDAVVKVLEAVRLIMDLPNVVVLIAIDQKIALASLALRYKELAVQYGAAPKSIARQYLGKVIHVPITLDDPAPKAVENYLSKLWATGDASEPTALARPDVDESAAPTDNLPDKAGEDQADQASAVVDDLSASSESGTETPKVSETPDTRETRQRPEQSAASKGLSQEQKDAFTQWAQKLGLANPRHIKRLDNAYNLIRMCYPDEDREDEPYYLLVMLMWIEYSRELPLETYATFRRYVRDEMAGEPDDTVVKSSRDKLDKCNTQAGLCWDEIKAVWEDNAGDKSPEDIRKKITTVYRQVRTFVLPAIEKDDL